MSVAALARRGGDSNLPKTVSGLKLWLDARRPGSTFADGDPVATWEDLSGLGNDVVQVTAAKKPLYRSQGRNLLTYNQATIETDLTGLLSAANTTKARSTAQALHGAGSLLVTVTDTASAQANTLNGTSGIPVTAATTYTAVVSGRQSVGTRTLECRINWWKNDGTYISTTTSTPVAPSGSGWTQSVATASAPALSAYATVIAVIGAGSANDAMYLDCLGLWAGSSATWAPPVTTPNGQPVVQFDGVDDVLSAAVAVNQPCTVYVVHRADTTGTARSWVAGATAFLGTSTTAYETYGGTALTTGTPNTTAWHVVDGVFNGASSTIAEGGSAGAAGAAGSTGFSALNIGALNAASQFMQGALATVLVYAGAHDANTRKRIERWLGRQFAVTVAQ